MENERWTMMNNSASELGTRTHKRHGCCRAVLWSSLLLLAVASVAGVTALILYLSQNPLPFMNRRAPPFRSDPPVISTNQEEGSALVTVSRGNDGQPISIFLDPNCPDYTSSFLRIQEVQSTLLSTLSNQNPEDKKGRGMAERLGEELKQLVGHAHNLRLEADSLRRGQSSLGQSLDTLQTEQARMIQLLADSQAGMLKVVNTVTEALGEVQRETGGLKTRSKTPELQRSPARPGRLQGCLGGRPRDCSDVLVGGQTEDGVYSVFPIHSPDGFQVYCDMTTDGGGWTVIQRREDGQVNFYRGWDAYRDGFGKTTGEHWLGLQKMHTLTVGGGFELRVDMADFENATAYARYGDFAVGMYSVNPEEDGYPLTVDDYSGTAGDSLLKHSGMRFTTRDRDQDQSENNCASFYQGAWWYRNCHTSNLNGQYLKGGHASYADGVEWSSWTGWQYSLRFTEMKIRPKNGADVGIEDSR
ncbi:fibrinogen C domain-containing protein 1 [Aplochiton taeniatus]